MQKMLMYPISLSKTLDYIAERLVTKKNLI